MDEASMFSMLILEHGGVRKWLGVFDAARRGRGVRLRLVASGLTMFYVYVCFIFIYFAFIYF